jgi:hypothetical protein
MSNLIRASEYNVDSSDDEIKKRKKVKPKIPPLPKRNVIIKNLDKDSGNWQEHWKPNQNIGLLPHPFRLVALGSVGRGKTNSCKQIFLNHQSTRRKFQKLVIITCDVDSQEWTDCDPDLITDQMIDLDYFEENVKTCVILDDFEWIKCSKEDQRKLSTLVRFISSHRNCSTMLSFQTFFDCPPIARKCATQFMIYKPNSRMELDTISNRCGLSVDGIRHIFKKICNKPYDHLMVDLSINTKAKLRRNIYEKIQLEDDSESESESD